MITAGCCKLSSSRRQANFENANLADVLMDRAVLNEANLKNANLERAVFTRYASASPYPSAWTQCRRQRAQSRSACLQERSVRCGYRGRRLLQRSAGQDDADGAALSGSKENLLLCAYGPLRFTLFPCRSSAAMRLGRTQSPAWRRGRALAAAAGGGSARAHRATRKARRLLRKRRRSSGAPCPRTAALA